jgi:hypothetical protein
MNGLVPIATVPTVGWIGIAAMGALMLAAVARGRLFDRLGATLAGDKKQLNEGLARTGTVDGAAKVARFATMLADTDEVRLIRWTPARTAEGVRIALGASPKAWYLWLPVPMVLMRVPDAFIDQMQHDDRGAGVVALDVTVRACDDVVTATDGDTVEEADDSLEFARSLLNGLVIVDPVAKAQADASAAAALRDETAAKTRADESHPAQPHAVSLAS